MAEQKLKAAEEKLKIEEQSLDSAQQALTKREFSSLTVISLAVANVAAIFKNHLPDLDIEILRKDFTIDDVEREALANSAYDTTHKFVSLYDFSSLSGVYFLSFCLTDLYNWSMSNLCSITSLRISDIYDIYHAKTSRFSLRKVMRMSSYL
jgi:hypothetical protein